MKIANVFIDGSFLGWRSMSPHYQSLGYEGKGGFIPTGTTFTFMRDLMSIIDKYGSKPSYAVIWDSKGNKRKEIDPEYKAHRKREKGSKEYDARSTMMRQLKELRAILPLAGITQVWCPGYEADDVLATLADMSIGGRNILVVRDKDMYQCISRATRLDDLKTIKDYKWFGGEYSILPKQWIEVQSLTGDSADNVPGVKGIGLKTALSMIRAYGDIHEAYSAGVLNGSQYNIAKHAMRLVELQKHLLLDFTSPALGLVKLRRVLKRKGLKQALRRVTVFQSVKGYSFETDYECYDRKELKDIRGYIVFSLVMIILTIFACTWIILQGVRNRNKVVLGSIEGLKSQVAELRVALEKHDNKLEWWERD